MNNIISPQAKIHSSAAIHNPIKTHTTSHNPTTHRPQPINFVGREGKYRSHRYRNIAQYATGDFSLAVVQANLVLKDLFQKRECSWTVAEPSLHGGREETKN